MKTLLRLLVLVLLVVAVVACDPPGPANPRPSASNTGHTGALTSSGSITVTQNGAVIANRDVSGPIFVNADHVTIRNSRIRTPGTYGISPGENTTGLRVENVTIEGTGFGCSAGISPNGSWVLLRSDISGCVDGIKVRSDQLVYANYVHDLRIGNLPDGQFTHNDALQSTSGSNVGIIGNTFVVDWQTGANAAIMMSSNFAALHDYTIHGNHFAGGQYVISIRNQGFGDPQNIEINHNVWAAGDWHYGCCNFAGTTVALGEGNSFDGPPIS